MLIEHYDKVEERNEKLMCLDVSTMFVYDLTGSSGTAANIQITLLPPLQVHPLLFILSSSSSPVHPLQFILSSSSSPVHPLQFILSSSSSPVHPLQFILSSSSSPVHPLQ